MEEAMRAERNDILQGKMKMMFKQWRFVVLIAKVKSGGIDVQFQELMEKFFSGRLKELVTQLENMDLVAQERQKELMETKDELDVVKMTGHEQ